MINVSHTFWTIMVMAFVTFALRAIPFLVFGNGKNVHPAVTYLGKVLPYAIIGMLVVYCLKSTTILQAPYGIPELIASILVVVLHVWRRNTLLSVGVGTMCYMLLVQLVF